jgi:peptidoglycan/LPS O-acetylase OafA/YrhL
MGSLRLFLALSVAFGHFGYHPSFPTVDPGVAVFVFFVLSGFYIALALNHKYVGDGSIPAFYVNRILRLWPGYLCGVALLAAAGDVTRVVHGAHEAHSALFGFAVLASNLTMLGVDTFWHLSLQDGHVVFREFGVDPAWNGSMWLLNPPAWSLAVEILFYAAAPFVVRSLRRSIAFALVGLAYCLWLRFAGPAPGMYRTDLYYPYHMMFFGLGMLTFQLYRRQKPWGAGMYVAVIAASVLVLQASLYVSSLIYLGACVAILALFDRTKANPLDRFLGDLSYPIYILHVPVGVFAGRFLGFIPAPGGLVLLTFATATLVLLLVERPIDRWRAGFRASARVALRAAAP